MALGTIDLQLKQGEAMAITLNHGKYEDDLFKDAQFVRTKVFMEEQGYEDEFDEVDYTCIHVVAYDGLIPVGCARVFVDDNDKDTYVIGRVAVLSKARKKGIGRLLVKECEGVAAESNVKKIILHAQARLEPWYGSMGYERFGEVDYEDEGQPHVWMEQIFKNF